jgi:hypothetical protein
MGSVRGPDQNQSISLSGSTLTIPASSTSPIKATIGGQQYVSTANLSTTLSGLTAGTTYFVYLILSSGSLALFVSASAPSVLGNSSYKLVGGVIADSSSTGSAIKGIYGAAMSDFVSYTPAFTGFGTVAAINFKSRRAGDSLEVVGQFQAGTTTATQAQIQIGYNGVSGNVVVDTNKVGGNLIIGSGGQTTFSSTNFGIYPLSPGTNANYINLGIQTSAQHNLTPINGNNIAPTVYIDVCFSVPIVGWSSTPLAYL